MARPQSTGVQPPDVYIAALRDKGRTLRAKYRGKPFDLAARLGIKLPEKPVVKMIRIGVLTEEEAVEKYGPIEPGIRELVEDLCLFKEDSAVAVATRGGGKSQSASFVEFYLVFVEGFDALNLGGSEFQAQQVYAYLVNYIESDPFWKTLIKTGEPQQERTDLKDGNWIQILAASSKSTRSRHAGGGGGKQRGGFLAIDEEAEAEPEHVNAALSTINTADPSVNLRCSTFHKAVGTFKELVDKHKEMGYKLYKWTIFDVAKPCDCPLDKVGCQSEEKCFREDHVEKFIDPETGREEERVIHKSYCGGVAKYSDGWIPMKTILATWRRMGRNHAQWEVEAMGSRPTTAGFVIKDPTWHAKNTTTESPAELYREGFPLSVLVDWGATAAGLEVWQEQVLPSGKERHVLLECDQVEEAGVNQIVGAVMGYVNKYRNSFIEVAADIGGGGNYLNPYLRDMGIQVRDVNFNQEKEAGVAAWNILNEGGKLVIPAEFVLFHEQVGQWRRNKAGKIDKGNDHLCDAAICYFSKFIERMGLSHIRIVPVVFSANGSSPTNDQTLAERMGISMTPHTMSDARAPVVVTLGGKSR